MKTPLMNFRKLECFLAVANELHYGRAAEKLHMAQPPLSRTILELEAELQVKLFLRNSRKVELTSSGVFLREEAKILFAHLDQIKSHLKEIEHGRAGKLKIGYVGSAMHSVLPGILDYLKQSFDINIILSELKNEEQPDAVSSGRIHIGISRSIPERKNIVGTKVFTETFSLILPLNHPLANKKKPDLTALGKDPYIGLKYDCVPQFNDSINEIFTKAGLSLRPAHETTEVNSLVRLVESGMGFSIVPTSVRKAYALNVKFFELTRVPQRAHLFLIHKKQPEPFVVRCVEIVREAISIGGF